MKMSRQLAARMREAILDGTWVAHTNFKDQLSGTTLEMATAQLHSLNTLAALAQHIHYYLHGVRQVFKGGELEIRDAYSFDFPVMESQHQWDAFLDTFWKETEEFAELIETLSDDQLQKAFVKVDYGTYQRNIDGMIEHTYYHLGQVVLIKKMISNLN